MKQFEPNRKELRCSGKREIEGEVSLPDEQLSMEII